MSGGNLILRCDFIPGTSIDEAAREAVSLARKLGVNVEFSFNGVGVFVTPSHSPGDVVREFAEEISRKEVQE